MQHPFIFRPSRTIKISYINKSNKEFGGQMKKPFVVVPAIILILLVLQYGANANLGERKEAKSRITQADAISDYRLISQEGKELTFEIDYTVQASHGNTVYIGGWIYDGNGKALGAYRPSAIPSTGTGKSRLVIILDRDLTDAKEVEFFFFEPSKAPFIKRRFSFDLKSGENPGEIPAPKAGNSEGSAIGGASGRPKPEEKWEWIGAQAKTLITGGDQLYMVNATTGDIFRYDGSPGSWTRIGGPGHSFVANQRTVYALSMDRGGIYEYMGKPEKWARIHGPAGAIYAGGADLYFTDAKTGDIHKYNPRSTKNVKFDVEGPKKIGGPGKFFTVDPFTGALYGLSLDMKGIYAYLNTPGQWKRIGGPALKIFSGSSTNKFVHIVYAIHPQNNSLYRIYYNKNQEKNSQTRIGGPSTEFAVGQFEGLIWGLSPDRSGIYIRDLSKVNKNGNYSWEKIGGPAIRIFGGGKCVSGRYLDQLYIIDSEQNVWRYRH
jgi:hypothetical protein